MATIAVTTGGNLTPDIATGMTTAERSAVVVATTRGRRIRTKTHATSVMTNAGWNAIGTSAIGP